MKFLLSVALIANVLACNSFWARVLDVREKNNDDELVDLMVYSDMYEESSSTTEEYAILTCYILFCKNEDASEGIGEKLYMMLKTYPEKWSAMSKLWKGIPARSQLKIETYFSRTLLFEYSMTRERITKEGFYTSFPYMKDVKIRQKEMLPNEDIYDFWVRKHYIEDYY